MSIFLTKSLFFIGLIVLFKAINNLYYFCIVVHYQRKYDHYLMDKDEWYISDRKQTVVKILKKANIPNNTFPYVEPVGYGQMVTANITLFDNFASLRKDIVQSAYEALRQAKAVFWGRMIESFNPFYWLEFILFLPRHALSYLGFSAEGLIIKILQIFWWLLNFLALTVGIFFNSEFRQWITSILPG